jgi:hypothetical protein
MIPVNPRRRSSTYSTKSHTPNTRIQLKSYFIQRFPSSNMYKKDEGLLPSSPSSPPHQLRPSSIVYYSTRIQLIKLRRRFRLRTPPCRWARPLHLMCRRASISPRIPVRIISTTSQAKARENEKQEDATSYANTDPDLRARRKAATGGGGGCRCACCCCRRRCC